MPERRSHIAIGGNGSPASAAGGYSFKRRLSASRATPDHRVAHQISEGDSAQEGGSYENREQDRVSNHDRTTGPMLRLLMQGDGDTVSIARALRYVSQIIQRRVPLFSRALT